jgi:Flp pilus assembly protein TadD
MEVTDIEADGVTPEQVRTLTEIGMMAAGYGYTAEAITIFESLRVLRPQRPFAYVGLAVASLNSGKPEEAVRVLEREGLAACPGDGDIRAFLGLALQLAQRPSDARRVLEALLAEQPEGEAARMARALLSGT